MQAPLAKASTLQMMTTTAQERQQYLDGPTLTEEEAPHLEVNNLPFVDEDVLSVDGDGVPW